MPKLLSVELCRQTERAGCLAACVQMAYASGDEMALKEAVERGTPPIIFVDTGELPYWNVRLRHAVLMVGYDEKSVYLNDPDQKTAPSEVSWGDLLLAWSEFDYKYSLVTLRK